MALAGCRVAREAAPVADAGPALAEPALPAPALETPPPSLLLDDAGSPTPFYAIAPPLPEVPAGDEERTPADAPAQPSAERAADETGPGPALPPEPVQAAVVVLAKGLGASTLAQIAQDACRGVAGQGPLWRTLDQGLRQLSCELRAGGRVPREALVMGSDGRLGATAALPFDLDPSRVAALVRDRALGSIASDGARALGGVRTSWSCPERSGASASGEPQSDAGYAALILRDEHGAITAGVVLAPASGRPEGWMSAAVVPGDYLFVQDATAAVVLGPDARLRAQGSARLLQQRAATMAEELAREVPLVRGAEQLVWLDRARVGSSNPQVTRFEWPKGKVPEACRSQSAASNEAQSPPPPAARGTPTGEAESASDEVSESAAKAVAPESAAKAAAPESAAKAAAPASAPSPAAEPALEGAP